MPEIQGLLTRAIARRRDEGNVYTSEIVIAQLRAIQLLIPGTVRAVVEGHENLALDAKADREALIRDLLEALQ